MRNISGNKCEVSINNSFPINGMDYYCIGFMVSQIFIFVFRGKHETKKSKIRSHLEQHDIRKGERELLVTIQMNQCNAYLSYVPSA